MAITGAHMLFYSAEADALRSVLAEMLGSDGVDAGGGWNIYPVPGAEIAVPPSDKAAHEITLMGDDLHSTMVELSHKGVEFRGEPAEETWGKTAMMVLPGAVDVMLYEPHHPTAI